MPSSESGQDRLLRSTKIVDHNVRLVPNLSDLLCPRLAQVAYSHHHWIARGDATGMPGCPCNLVGRRFKAMEHTVVMQ